jgi:hypothetical protein
MGKSRFTPKPKRYATIHSEIKTARDVSLRNQNGTSRFTSKPKRYVTSHSESILYVASHPETKLYVPFHSENKMVRDVSLRNQNGTWRLTPKPKRCVTFHSETKRYVKSQCETKWYVKFPSDAQRNANSIGSEIPERQDQSIFFSLQVSSLHLLLNCTISDRRLSER